MAWRIGVDIGGTFTDFALLDEASSRVWIHKQLSTPPDPAVAVLEGIPILLAKAGAALKNVDAVIHGTTLVTNAVIERKGARVGMLVTAGFRDVLDIGRELRYDMFDLRQRFPSPLVPRRLRLELKERIRYDGTIEIALDPNAARATIANLIEEGRIQALAVCLLNAYANPAHEQMIAAICAADFPHLPVSTSADVWPQMRELERWTTTTANSYTQPLVDHYLRRLEQGLAVLGFTGQLYIMTSSGGTVLPSVARRYPVRLLDSGPAAGALMAAALGRRLGAREVLAFDMGGTTAKGCIIRGGEPLRRYDFEVARLHEFKRGSGLTLSIPAIDMIEIGAGGGSIAAADTLGILRVGPQSAGAHPGPACYGRGGTRPTLTDANLVLGIYDPACFLGGTMPLHAERARSAIASGVATPLNISVTRASSGIHEIINEDVARAFRIHASERGIDHRNCTMVAFGGSGPAHAIRIARKLRIPRVVVPGAAGVFCALGLLVSPLAFEVVRSRSLLLADIHANWWETHIAPLVDEATAPLIAAGVSLDAIQLRCRLGMRYVGQGHEIEVVLPEDSTELDADAVAALFEARYRALYAHTLPATPLQIVTWRVEAMGPDPLGSRPIHVQAGAARCESRPSRRVIHLCDAGDVDCPVYERSFLSEGDRIEGPALVQEPDSTCVIGPGDVARMDAEGNLLVDLSLEPVRAAAQMKEAAL
jgi:N-methylhydantoinase A